MLIAYEGRQRYSSCRFSFTLGMAPAASRLCFVAAVTSFDGFAVFPCFLRAAATFYDCHMHRSPGAFILPGRRVRHVVRTA